MKYIKEIDGLRGFAVAAVILFHSGFTLFNAGFIGVDVFFVISGYLVTKIILEDLVNEKFSMMSFYERRLRRIVPGLYFIILCLIPLAIIFLSAKEVKEFFESLASIPFFLSNLFFLKSSNYFDVSSEFKLLLHTWSLSIEEQFYLIFPIFLILCWKFSKSKVGILIVISIALSLIAAQWGSSTHPQFTFYMLPTRSFELMSGAAISYYEERIRKFFSLKQTFSHLMSIIGLFLLLYGLYNFNENTPWPSFYTLAPVIGTALIIAFSSCDSLVNRMFRFKPLVGIGLISYSAYLWHQPIIVILKQRSMYGLTPDFLKLVFVFILALSYITWRFVELPFRRNTNFKISTILVAATAISISFVCLGVYAHYKMSPPESMDEPLSQINKLNISKKILVLGDSHAGHLAYGLASIFGDMVQVDSIISCIPFYEIDRYDSRSKRGFCPEKVENALNKFIRDDRYRVLVFSSMVPVYLDNTTFKGKDPARIKGQNVELVSNSFIKDRWAIFEIGMRKTLDLIVSVPNKKIIFSLDVPELGIDSKSCGVPREYVEIFGTKFGYGEAITFDSCKQKKSDFLIRNFKYHKLIKNILMDYPSVYLFDPTNLFCDDNYCYGSKDGHKFYSDADHLSEFGSVHVAKPLSLTILNALK